jgi:hypothetical protein
MRIGASAQPIFGSCRPRPARRRRRSLSRPFRENKEKHLNRAPKSIRGALVGVVVALAALAVVAPVASASGWRLERANAAIPYTGPVTIALSAGTDLDWAWAFPTGTTYPSCTTSSGTGTITSSGAIPPYVPAGSLSSWSATGNPYFGGTSCAKSNNLPLGGSWVGSSVPWSMSIGTFAGNQPKLAIQNPTVQLGTGPVLHSTAVLEGKIVNPPNGTQTARVQFNDANDALGLNNRLSSVSYGTLDLTAEYTLTGQVGGLPQNLKVVWVP